MIRRRKPLRRLTPLKRGGPIRRVSKRRRRQRVDYATVNREYLQAHPFCQITLALNRISETLIIDALKNGEINAHAWGSVYFKGIILLLATQIHHRNKCRAARLNDTRWFMSASQTAHDWVENHKDEARKIGLLLPIQADAEGRWGADNQALTTDELIAVRARGTDQ